MVTVSFIGQSLLLEVALNVLFVRFLLRTLCCRQAISHGLLGVHGIHSAAVALVNLFLAEVPQVDLAVVNTSGQLVDIGQVLKTQDEVVDKPRSVLAAISDVFLALVVSGHLFLLATTRAHCHRTVLVLFVVGISGL